MNDVMVGLSGGVDSAVSAALLQQEGWRVTGVFVKIWQPEFAAYCTWQEDRLAAKRNAAALGIPFQEVDLSERYRTHVIDDLVRAYRSGRTPNPDVLCNRTIKFGALADYARARGAARIATGHYAQVRTRGDTYELLRGHDAQKDQSYFLWQLRQEDLAYALFPVGGYEKPQVRDTAVRLALPAAARPDSQGLCFVGDVDMQEFLAELLAPSAGDVLDVDGRVVGRHGGAVLFTLGQRHGFFVTDPARAGIAQYVVAVDAEHNTITVDPDRIRAARRTITLNDCSWISSTPPPEGCYVAQVRYLQRAQPCRLSLEAAGQARVEFDEPQLAAAGQSLVVYAPQETSGADVCLGGGIIS